MYVLADCNNFFVSCERVFRPDLEGRPVVVLSGNDGCVVSRSNEAKALGIKMGVPLFKIRDLVSKEGVVCFSSNFELYGDLSARVMRTLARFADRIEQYSIDEAFLSFDDAVYPAEKLKTLSEHIVSEIRYGIGIPISLGIAPSRTLAKIASKYAKRYAGYHGACLIDTDDKRRKALADFAIDDVWGIGRRSVKKLYAAGIHTALDLADADSDLALNMMHKPGLQTWQELNGQDVCRIDELVQHLTITRSRTFAKAITTLPAMEAYVADFLSACANKLRRQGSYCSDIILFALPSRFMDNPGAEQFYAADVDIFHNTGGIYTNIHLAVPTNVTAELLEHVLKVLRGSFVNGYPYKRAGVILTGITDASTFQTQLFDERDRNRDNLLQSTIDKLNSRHGKNTIRLATQLKTDEDKAKLHNEYLSPCYSTRLTDIITVKC